MRYVQINPKIPILDNFTTQEKIFAARGIAPQDVYHYLHTDETDNLSPTGLDNLREGAELLAKHIRDNNKIYVVVDSDVDGFTSAAVLLNYLHYEFPYFVESNIEYGVHSGKQHGLADFMDRILNSNCKLVIVPDAGSNDYEEHHQLKENGIDVLVIDHHEVPEYSEDAIVINNQISKNYLNKDLSGVGVVYKFCQYFDEILNISNADYFRDLVAIGLIADMMNVRSFETKYLIESGLITIHNPLLKEIISNADYQISRYGGLCPHTIGFYVTPLINSTIRFGEEEDKLLVFEAMLVWKGEELISSTKRGCKGQLEMRATQAARTAATLKRKQDDAVTLSMKTVKDIIEEKELYKNKIIAVKLAPGTIVNKNITGLIANKLIHEYRQPVLLLNETELDGEKTWAGSGRNIETPELESLREFIEESDYALYATGHSSAFGSAIRDENFEEFIAYANEALADCNFDSCATVDFIWPSSNIKFKDIEDIAALNLLYGQGFEQPKVVVENITITKDNIRLCGEKCPTLNISLGPNVKAIKFRGKDIYEDILPSEIGSTTINILGTCSLNEFNGTITAQIEIEDYEIVNRLEYYF